MMLIPTHRTDIQGLRAIAVALVIFFHVWPTALSGGYVGVDVFFVISGYLITGLLYREVASSGSISLSTFYSRRIRRLLPAATTVLLTVTILTPLLLPQARWEDTAIGVLASALYLENWHLAWLAVDYLGAEKPPSPVQHYWSLSIEEQFYVVWPLTIIASLALIRRRPRPARSILIFLLSAITATSFLASVWVTYNEPTRAYFVTHTRIWELGLGGLLAIVRLPAPSLVISEILRISGLVAILVSAMLFSHETRFPGYAALLPTLACAAVIYAGTNTPKTLSMGLLGNRVVQYLGDISYSLYLWHWPLIVFVASYTGANMGLVSGVAVILFTLIIADLTKRFIEDPFRQKAKRRPVRTPRTFSLALTSIGLCVVAAATLYMIPRNSRSGELPIAAHYPGPAAILSGFEAPAVEHPMPLEIASWRDLPAAYADGCHLGIQAIDLNPCIFGDPDGQISAFVIGDSHAANWIPAFEWISQNHGWYVETHTKSGCPVLVELRTLRGGPYTECLVWGEKVLRSIEANDPDIVLIAMSSGTRLYDERIDLSSTLDRTWQRLEDAADHVFIVADTPRHEIEPAECIENDVSCSSPRDQVLRPDPALEAYNNERRARLIDMTDAFCSDLLCPMIIGNVVVWRDTHHLTATYSRMLGPYLLERMTNLLEP